MEIEPHPPERRSVRSFEFDSPVWWRESGIWIVGIFSLAALLAYLTAPSVTRRHPSIADHREAVNNARQIGLALTEFEGNYGKMPDESTIEAVKKDTATDLNLGIKSSNDFFRQLLAAGTAQGEPMFYSKIQGTRKPDNDFTKAKALEKGECGFTYFMGAVENGNPLRPIAATPMSPGTDRFDPVPFNGKAVILRADLSVNSGSINSKTGYVKLDGMDMFDPANPVWDGHPPVIAWPEL